MLPQSNIWARSRHETGVSNVCMIQITCFVPLKQNSQWVIHFVHVRTKFWQHCRSLQNRFSLVLKSLLLMTFDWPIIGHFYSRHWRAMETQVQRKLEFPVQKSSRLTRSNSKRNADNSLVLRERGSDKVERKVVTRTRSVRKSCQISDENKPAEAVLRKRCSDGKCGYWTLRQG